MNVFSFVGNVGKDDAVLRFTTSGTPVLGFSVAATAGYGDKKQTMWIKVSYWGKPGESVAPYVLAGTKVAVSGELSTHEHDGKTYLEVRANSVTLLGSKPESKPKAEGFREKVADESAFDDGPLPF